MRRLALASVAVALLTASVAGAQTPPTVSFTSLRVVPSPAAGAVRSVFNRARGRFAACNPDATEGRVTLSLQTDANGQVTVTRRRGSTFTDDAGTINGCVARTAERLQFPNSTLGTLDIMVTVQFGPPAAR